MELVELIKQRVQLRLQHRDHCKVPRILRQPKVVLAFADEDLK
jgi:hypothetical protein